MGDWGRVTTTTFLRRSGIDVIAIRGGELGTAGLLAPESQSTTSRPLAEPKSN